jgi:hypothetical protein
MCVAAVPRYLLWHPALAVPRTLVDAAVLQHDDIVDAVAVWCPVERRAGSRHTRACSVDVGVAVHMQQRAVRAISG